MVCYYIVVVAPVAEEILKQSGMIRVWKKQLADSKGGRYERCISVFCDSDCHPWCL